jgi:hypothetical protein
MSSSKLYSLSIVLVSVLANLRKTLKTGEKSRLSSRKRFLENEHSKKSECERKLDVRLLNVPLIPFKDCFS